MKKRILGIIGGSGLYSIEGLQNVYWKKLRPHGENLLAVFCQQVLIRKRFIFYPGMEKVTR